MEKIQISQMGKGRIEKIIGGEGQQISQMGIEQYFVGLMDGYGSIQVNQ